MRDLYSHTGKGTLVEKVGSYEIRQINPIVTEHDGQLFPYSYIVVGQTVEAAGNSIVLPDQVNLGSPVLAICQTIMLARDVIAFLESAETTTEALDFVQKASRH